MSDVDVGKTRAADRALEAIAEVERLLEATQRRALRQFSERGVLDWTLLNEWMDAESAACRPATEFEERETEYVLRIALPGLEPTGPDGAAKPRQLVIRTRHEGDRRTRSVTADRPATRRAVPPVFRPETVKATLRNGVLTLSAPKAGGAAAMPLPGNRAAVP